MPLESLSAQHGGLDDFRMSAPAEVSVMLKKLLDGNVIVNLNGSDGTAYTTTLWLVDPQRGTLSFCADGDSNQVQDLVEAEDAVAVAYLDNIKLQFDAQGLALIRSGTGCVLSCALPREIFRFQRRSAFRVKPLLRSTPMASFRHPMLPDMQLSLRVLDLSIGGCALFLPDDVPPLQPGVLLNGVALDLDVDTRITAALRLQHVTAINPDAKGVRLGCEFASPNSDMTRTLQRFIDQMQKRQRMLSL